MKNRGPSHGNRGFSMPRRLPALTRAGADVWHAGCIGRGGEGSMAWSVRDGAVEAVRQKASVRFLFSLILLLLFRALVAHRADLAVVEDDNVAVFILDRGAPDAHIQHAA